MDDMLLENMDEKYHLDNLVFNYCLNNEETLIIKSYLHNHQIKLGFLPDQFYFYLTGTHKKYRLGATPSIVKSNMDDFLTYCSRIDGIFQEHGFIGKSFIITVDGSRQVGIMFSSTEKADCTAHKLADIMHQAYCDQFADTVFITSSSTSFAGPYSGYEQIHQAFLDARALNDLRFFGIRDVVITKEYREKTARPCDISAIHANMRRLMTIICSGTCTQALRCADSIIRDMIVPSYSMDHFNAMFMHVQDMIGMLETVYPHHIRLESKTADDFCLLEDYHLYLRKTICTIFDQLSGIPKYSPTILMTLSYINRNYARELSLLQLSEYVYANPSTLSSEFNSEVGMSLSEYITSLRIEKAQELLLTTTLTIPAIAEQAGFTGSTYFRKIFKKQTGLSAQAYRKQNHLPNMPNTNL